MDSMSTGMHVSRVGLFLAMGVGAAALAFTVSGTSALSVSAQPTASSGFTMYSVTASSPKVTPMTTDKDPRVQPEHTLINLDAAYADMGVTDTNAGRGVKVGVLDSGIAVFGPDYIFPTNPCFTDEGYAVTDRLGKTILTNNKVVVAKAFGPKPFQIHPGAPMMGGVDPTAFAPHGSHVAGIIACNVGTTVNLNGNPVTIHGVAPAVTLGNYNVFPGGEIEGFGPTDADLADGTNTAVADGMKILNMSFGSSVKSPLVQKAINDAWDKGVISVVAAGNEGPSFGTVGVPGNNVNAITVGSVSTGRALYAHVNTVASNDPAAPTVDTLSSVGSEITVPSDLTGRLVAVTKGSTKPDTTVKPHIPNTTGLGYGCSPKDYPKTVRGNIALVSRGVCYFSQKMVAAKKAGAVAVILVNRTEDLTPLTAGSAVPRNFPETLVGYTAGMNLVKVARVGGSVTITHATLFRTTDEGALSEFSSVGPTYNGINKPDVVAPGGSLLSAVTDESCLKPSKGCFAIFSGTSMATPVVVGITALVEQAHPDWTPAMVRSAVIHTATRQDGMLVNQQGVGLVDADAAVTAPLGFADTQVVLTPGSTGNLTILNPYDTAKDVTLTVVPADGTTADSPITLGAINVQVPAHGQVTVPVTSTGSKGVAKIQALVAGRTINTIVSIH